MKKLLCTLTVLFLVFCTVQAEPAIIEKPEIIIEMITPSPSPEPAGETYSSEALTVTLPAGMRILGRDEHASYAAAVSFAYPDGGDILLMAMNETGSAVLSFTLTESARDAASAAKEAALSIPFASVQESTLGGNSFSALRCSMNGEPFRLFFLSDGSRLLCVGASGLEDEAVNAMLTGLDF